MAVLEEKRRLGECGGRETELKVLSSHKYSVAL